MITFESLKTLEVKINKSCLNSKNYMGWMESNIRTNYERKWNKMMLELRGWDVITGETKNAWIDYCQTQNMSIDYTFGDILS